MTSALPPKHFALVEQAQWTAIFEARRQGATWLDLRTRTGFPALGRAIVDERLELVERLLNAGAPATPMAMMGQRMFSPLWAAVERQLGDIVGLLLQAGADPNEPPPEGSPDSHLLGLASSQGDAASTVALLQAGAKPLVRDDQGLTAMEHWHAWALNAATDPDSPPTSSSMVAVLQAFVQSGAPLHEPSWSDVVRQWSQRPEWGAATQAVQELLAQDSANFLTQSLPAQVRRPDNHRL